MASASDFPVTIPFDPLIAIQTGITRSSTEDDYIEVLYPEERTSLEEMLVSYTYNGAFANYLEDQVGSLEVGKQADLIILDQNLFDLSPESIFEAKVLLTMIDGVEVFRSPDWD